MKETSEWLIYLIIVAGLSYGVSSEGIKTNELKSQIFLRPKTLLAKISHPQIKLQIVDIRSLKGSDSYEDSHIPGAIPFPGCDLEQTPTLAKNVILKQTPTVVITLNGEADSYLKCRQYFNVVQNLSGGMKAWIEQSLPEDSGEYSAPKSSAGGGCL